MTSFKLTPAAKADLLNIGRYTQERWGQDQRNKYLTELDQRFTQLAKHPYFGRERIVILKVGMLFFIALTRKALKLSGYCMFVWILSSIFKYCSQHLDFSARASVR